MTTTDVTTTDMTTTDHPVRADEAPVPTPDPRDVWFAGTLMRIHADRASTDGQLALIEQWGRRGFSPPLHVHHQEDQLLFVVEGAITARIGEHEQPVAAGESVWLPRHVPHTFRVDSEDVHLLEVTTPGGFEQFHVDAGDPALDARVPDPTEPDVGRMLATIAPYGAEIVGPPMQ